MAAVVRGIVQGLQRREAHAVQQGQPEHAGQDSSFDVGGGGYARWRGGVIDDEGSV